MTKASKILVPIDFSEKSLEAFAQAVNMASVNTAEVVLIHVQNDGGTMSRMFNSAQLEVVREEVKTRLGEIAAREQAKSGVTVSIRVRSGKPYRKILELAVEENVMLVIMGMNSGDDTGEFIGSTTSRVLRTSPCPVITITGSKHPDGCKVILLPLDLSKQTTAKVESAISYAQMYGAALKIVSVLEDGEEFEYNSLSNQMLIEVMKVRKAGVEVDAEFVRIIKGEDSVASGIIAYADRVEADLMVIMTQQENKLAALFIGSEAQELIRKSKAPVMSIHPN